MSRIQEIFHDWVVHKGNTREPQRSPVGINVIAITGSPERQAVIEQIATDSGWGLFCTASVADALAIKGADTAVILIDREVLGTDWRDALARLLDPPHRCCVVLMSPNRTDRFCYDFIQHGGYSVLKTPLQTSEVVGAVRLAAAFWKACISRRCRGAGA